MFALLIYRGMPIEFRNITAADDQPLAALIRKVLDEFRIPRTGTVYSEPTTDRLSVLFEAAGAVYMVAEEDGILLGGCGIYPTPGLPEGCAELVKLYLTDASRGKGIGRQLMDKCFTAARQLGYTQLYLESFPQLDKAVSMYIRSGFEHLDKPMGNSGHHACTIWMLKAL